MLGCKNLRDRRDLCQISWGFHLCDITKFHRQLQRQRCIRVLAEAWAKDRKRKRILRKRALRKRTSGKLWVALILLANQNNSLGQPKESLRVATAIRYNYYIQLVATKRDWMRIPNLKFWSPRQRGGWQLVVHEAVSGVYAQHTPTALAHPVVSALLVTPLGRRPLYGLVWGSPSWQRAS